MTRVLILCTLLLCLTGCDVMIGGDTFFNKINEIEAGLEAPNWTELAEQAKELEEMYKKDKWKLQFLGDEGEYESLYENIHKLIAAAEEMDRTNFKLELTVTRTIIEGIYSL